MYIAVIHTMSTPTFMLNPLGLLTFFLNEQFDGSTSDRERCFAYLFGGILKRKDLGRGLFSALSVCSTRNNELRKHTNTAVRSWALQYENAPLISRD